MRLSTARECQGQPVGLALLLPLTVLLIATPILASEPSLPRSPCFTSPILGGGRSVVPPGPGFILAAGSVGGFWWELGMGDPVDGAGNDASSAIAGHPVITDAPWISRVNGIHLYWDWYNIGSDGCLSGGAGTGVMVFYLLDSEDRYAVLAVGGYPTPIPHHNLDTAVTGVGPFGNDIPLASRTYGIQPVLSNLAIVDLDTMTGDVAPVIDGMNVFYDAGGPYTGLVSTDGFQLWSGGTTVNCNPVTGCTGVLLSRNEPIVWEGFAEVIANQTSPECDLAPGVACDPDAPPEEECFGGAAGPCNPGVLTPFGPPIPGGVPSGRDCQFDLWDTLRVTRQGATARLDWEAHPDAQGYQVFRCEPTTGPCPPLPLATTPNLSHVDPLDDAGMVWYQVAAMGDDCPAGEDCIKQAGGCWGDGVCTPRPSLGCPGDLPICGCDGASYEHPCQAGWSGISIWHFGYCL